MAYFPPFNGDSQPVFALDIQNGPQTGTITAAALVQPQGPKLDFFKVIIENAGNQAQNLCTQLGSYSSGVFTPGAVNQINSAIQQTATIAMYQVEADATGQISYALYPTGAYTTTTLTQTIIGLGNIQITASDGTVTGLNVAGSQATSSGFKLA
jgi:hypothetical protein